MLQAGNSILRNHIFLLEIKYFCKLKELPWAELSPNCVSLFVGCFDKHIRAEALIFGLNLITSRPKFAPTRSPLLRLGFLCFTQSRVGWGGAEGPQVWVLVGLSPPGALRDMVWSGCCYWILHSHWWYSQFTEPLSFLLWEYLLQVLLWSFLFLKRQKFILMLNLGLKQRFSSPTCFGAKCDVLEDVSATAAWSLNGKTGIKAK